MKYLVLFAFLLSGIFNHAQEISGNELLEKAIAFHDPENNWSSFKGKMLIEMENPKGSPRRTVVEMKYLTIISKLPLPKTIMLLNLN
jgi:hypothetical protein